MHAFKREIKIEVAKYCITAEKFLEQFPPVEI